MSRHQATSNGLGDWGEPHVDLMPAVEVERRSQQALMRNWVRVIFLAVVLIAFIILGTVAYHGTATQQLRAEQDRSTALIGEIAQLSDVNQMLAATTDLRSFRTEAMSNDIDFEAVFSDIVSELPSGGILTQAVVVSGGVAVEDPASDIGLAAELTIQSNSALDIAEFTRALNTLEWVVSAEALSVTSQNSAAGGPPFQYVVRFDTDQTIYTNDFERYERPETVDDAEAASAADAANEQEG